MICYFCFVVQFDELVTLLLELGEQFIVLALAFETLKNVFLLLMLLTNRVSHKRRFQRIRITLTLLTTVASVLFVHVRLFAVLRLVHLREIGILSVLIIVLHVGVEFLELSSHRWTAHVERRGNRSRSHPIHWTWSVHRWHVRLWPASSSTALHREVHRWSIRLAIVSHVVVAAIVVVVVSEVVDRSHSLVHLWSVVELLKVVLVVHHLLWRTTTLLLLLLLVAIIIIIVVPVLISTILEIHIFLRASVLLSIHFSLVVHVVLWSRCLLLLIIEVVAEIHEARILIVELLPRELLGVEVLLGIEIFTIHSHVIVSSALILHLSFISTQHTILNEQ